MIRFLLPVFVCLFVGLSYASAQTVVKVAHSSFQAPFVVSIEQRKGLVVELIAAMNESQSRYVFELDFVPSKRLLSSFQDEGYDLIAFNDLQWGWSSYGAEGSLPLTLGQDVFFRATDTAQTRKALKRIAAVRGFHYSFADFDENRLEELPHVILSKDVDGVVRNVILGRAKTGVSSRAYLNWLQVTDPELFSKLIIMNKIDQRYQRRFVRLVTATISVEAVDSILNRLAVSGQLREIYKRYGLELPLWAQTAQ